MKSYIKAAMVALCTLWGLGTNAASLIEAEYPEMPIHETKRDGTLLLSDCPEYANIYGILAEGTLAPGKGRIYYYHVNDTEKPARLVVYAQSDKEKTVEITRTLRGVPSQNYIPTGKSLSVKEIRDKRQPHQKITVVPRKRTVLFEENKEGIREGDLVSGLVEVEIKSPLTVGVAFLPGDKEIEETLSYALKLPPDSHEMRGTFSSELYLENNNWRMKDGATMINLGSPESISPFFLKGRDEMNFIQRENTGNYGITCYLTIHSEGKGRYDLYLNPMGGTYEGALEVRQGSLFWDVFTTKGKGNRWFGEGTIGDIVKIGTFEGGQDLHIKFMPPGASSFPIRFLFVPVN